MKKNWKTLCWGLKLAFRIDGKSLLLWAVFSILLSLLPAVSLGYQRTIIAAISETLSAGTNTYGTVQANIIFYGAILTLIALSSRFNDDMLYMIMYDSYYLGLEDVMMTSSQKIPLSKLMEKQTGDDYFAAISRCGALTDLTSSGCALIGKIVSIISLLAVAAGASSFIAVIAAAYLIIALLMNSRFAKKNQVVWSRLRKDMRRADYLEKLVRESDPSKETRLYGSLGMVIKEWRRAYQKVEDIRVRSESGKSLLKLLLQCGLYLFLLIIMFWACFSVFQGSIKPDLALMMFSLCLSFAEALSSIPQSYQRLSYGLYGLGIQRDFFEKADEKVPEALPEEERASEEENVVFEAKDVSFSYGGGKKVLQNLNFKIYQGESIALLGANGAGKSTLIKLLLGLYRPESGNLYYRGKPYTPKLKKLLAEKIGSFFQDYYLFHLTAGENVGAGDVSHIDDIERIERAVKEGGAAEIVNRLPKKLNNLIGVQVYREGAELSGGEKQRIAVSRAFMSDKEVLIFDEPASMLDPFAELKQFESIKRKVRLHTSILVSHRIGFARLADRIFVVDGGKISESGTHEELLEKDGIYAKLFNEQARWYQAGKSEGL